MIPIGISAIDVALAGGRMTVAEMAKRIGMPEADLFQKIGVREKPVLNNGENIIDLAIRSAQKLIQVRQLDPSRIDYILYGTGLFQDHLFSSSAKIQKEIGATKAFSFDFKNGCNSGNLGLQLAANLLRSNDSARCALLILADAVSQIIDYSNPDHVCLFGVGDGASAILLEKGHPRNQLLSFTATTNAQFADTMHLNQERSRIVMSTDPKEDEALTKEYELRYQAMIRKALDLANLKVSDIDHLFMNQGDHRLIHKLEKSLPIASEKVFRSHAKSGHVGNTDCFLALKTRLDEGKIKPGQNIVVASSGVGFSWSASVIRG